jgi:hypothetical protein
MLGPAGVYAAVMASTESGGGSTRAELLASGRHARLRQLFCSPLVALVLALIVSALIGAPIAVGIQFGGGGRVTTSGGVGGLQIDRSARADVLSFAGQPDAQGTGSFGDPSADDYQALGYMCQPQSAAGFTGVSARGPYCRTVYFINSRDLRFAAFFTSSAAFVGPGGMKPGAPAAPPERRTHHVALSGCFSAISFGGRGASAYLIADVTGGRTRSYSGPHGSSYLRILGGRIADIELESGLDPVGLLFC